jgi:hypothetical protein
MYFGRLDSNISEEPTSSILMAEILIFYYEDGVSRFLRNIDIHRPNYIASHPRRPLTLKHVSSIACHQHGTLFSFRTAISTSLNIAEPRRNIQVED